MALFSKTTKETKVKKVSKKAEEKAIVKAVAVASQAPLRKDSLSGVLIRPRITEKATLLAEKDNVYVFEVHADSSKPIIAKMISSLYGVSPLKIAIVKNPTKAKMVRGKMGYKSGVKKAYIYLKKGEKIEFA